MPTPTPTPKPGKNVNVNKKCKPPAITLKKEIPNVGENDVALRSEVVVYKKKYARMKLSCVHPPNAMMYFADSKEKLQGDHKKVAEPYLDKDRYPRVDVTVPGRTVVFAMATHPG